MDWTKAKTILIVVLLATNAFLLVSITSKGKPQNTNEVALLTILENKGIMLQAELPKKQSNMQLIHGDYLLCDEEEVNALIEAQNYLPEDADEDAYAAAAGDFIEYLGVFSENVVFDCVELERDTARVRFKNVVDNIVLAGSYMMCTFENGKLSDFDYKWLKPTEMSPQKVETVSAAVALMSLTRPEDFEIITVTGIEMIYWIPDTDTDIDVGNAISDTAFPTWRITTEEAGEFFVEAVQR